MLNGQPEQYQLVCLPFAGGNEFSYQKLEEFLPENISIVTVELPGKGNRIKEKPLNNLDQIVEEIGNQLEKKINKPYAIYGHSMGALTGHLLAKWLIKNGMPLPEHLFFTSYFAPSHHHDKGRSNMTDQEFIDHLQKLNGLPPALLQEKKLLDIFLPILRADIEAIDNYRYVETKPHNIPLTVVFGNGEKGLASGVRDWKRETTAEVNIYRFEGDHFFIFKETQRLCGLISTTLQKQYAFEP